MKITAFDKRNIADFQREAIAALKDLADRYGVSVREAGGKWSPEKFTMHIEAKIADPQAAADLARATFNRKCSMFELLPSDFGAKFEYNPGDWWELVGLEPNRPKFCVQAKNVRNGEIRLLTTSALAKIRAARAVAPAPAAAPRISDPRAAIAGSAAVAPMF